MDIEIVLDGSRVVGASTKKQGAESIRIDEANRLAAENPLMVGEFYDRMTITNTELRDVE